MNMLYLLCFILGLTLSILSIFGGLGRVHFGHLHFGHAHAQANHAGGLSAINGFTLPAFLCWFGGAGYLLKNYSPLLGSVALLLAAVAGLVGGGIIYAVLFKFLLPRERVLQAEDTRMDGVVGRVSDEIRPGGIGEILFSQTGARRGAPARSESGEAIARGTEVVVLRYAKGIAYVTPLEEMTR
jgi:membrane protein implicated in regulation of membrane protease activity